MKQKTSWFIAVSLLILLSVIISACGSVRVGPPATAQSSTRIPSNRAGTQAPDIGATRAANRTITPPADSAYPAPEDNLPPYEPRSSDASLKRGEVFLVTKEVVTMESNPPQFALALEGSLPTPCHELRVEIAPPDQAKHIEATAYSLVDPGVVCAQVLQAFTIYVPLKDLPPGKYTISVNGQSAGEVGVP